jgi:hypothetical protein
VSTGLLIGLCAICLILGFGLGYLTSYLEWQRQYEEQKQSSPKLPAKLVVPPETAPSAGADK